MKQFGGARAGGRELGDRAGGSSWRGMELAHRAMSGGGRGTGAGKPGWGGQSKGARAGGRGSELEAAGGAKLGGGVRPRVDCIRDHCVGHSSVVPVWLSSLPACFLPGSYNLSELSFPF